MLNPAGLRRFPSPHLSLFFGFLVEFSDSNEEGRGVGSYIRGVTPVARGGGATGPLFFQGPRCKFEEKNYTKGLSPYGRATGGYF